MGRKGDFFVVQELFNKNMFVNIMLGLCVCGFLLKVVLNIMYLKLMKASDNMGTSKNKLTQMMKKKFETCYKLKIGVNNVDIFVDKYVYRHKFCGFLLSTWENICGQILMLCLLIGSISAVLGLIYECGKQEILSTFSVGILTSGLLIFLEGMMNFSGKRELIRLNMKDYLENFFKVRLEQELIHPGLIEQYKKELLIQEEGELVMKNPALVAATSTENLRKSNERVENRVAKKQKKEAAKLGNQRKKVEVKAAKERLKVDRRLEIEKKKQEIERQKLEARKTEERIKKEAKLAIKQKKEAERAEIIQKKADARDEEQQKREEKHRQEEIKRALLLEKQVEKEEKQKQTVEHKTIAQERKESLKREVQERRLMEVQKPERELETQNTQIDIVSVTALDSESETQKVNEGSKVQVKSIHNKKSKQADSSEEKLIEDILKEFLA